MTAVLIIIIIGIAGWFLVNYFAGRKDDEYNRGTDNYNRGDKDYNKGSESTKPKSKFSWFSPKEKKEKQTYSSGFFSNLFAPSLPFDEEAILWCANLLAIDKAELKSILRNMPIQYKNFRIGKRSGGYRTISAPNEKLLSIQKTIYYRILLPVNIHPAATGFRKNISIINNAKPHLKNEDVLKTDIIDFFGSIHQYTVAETFKKIGYPSNISEVLAELCCRYKRLPQGAPTSPALSNIIAYEMDKNLATLSKEYNLTYTRYADDLTFSGSSINHQEILPKISKIVKTGGFALQQKKTRFLTKGKRKIITGISIGSGEKLTIPKQKKRELRQNIYYILKRGLKEHQRHIESTDPAYLKRIIGYLNYWHQVEPDNKYVTDSLKSLKKLNK